MNLLVILLTLPMLAAFATVVIGKKTPKYQPLFNVSATLLEFILILLLFPRVHYGSVTFFMPWFMGVGLNLTADLFRYVLLFITGLGFLLTTIFSMHYPFKDKNRNRYYLFLFLTYAMVVGVFLSSNIINLFTFFEGMSFASYFLVINDEDVYSHEAGRTYLALAIAGGMVTLMGIFLAYDYTETLDILRMGEILPTLGNEKYLVAALILFGFAIKAGMYPLHTWIPKAYPAAPAPSSALLSGILMKTGLFGILLVVIQLMNFDKILSLFFYGIGLLNIFWGGFLAMMQRNMKRIIAYSSMSQAGFMMMGIGLVGILGQEGGVAFSGTVLYMVNHFFFKTLLFLSAGMIYMLAGDFSINNAQGLGRGHKFLHAIFLIGILGLIACPLFSGYISKTMIHEAIVEAHHATHHWFFELTEYAYLLGGSLTTAYMTKLYLALFWARPNPAHQPRNISPHREAYYTTLICASFILAIGLIPSFFARPLFTYCQSMGLDLPHTVSFYSTKGIAEALLSIGTGLLIYQFFIRRFLIVRGEACNLYRNPSLTWIRLEEDIFVPFFNGVFHISSKIFHVADVAVVHGVTKMADLFEHIVNLDEGVFRSKDPDSPSTMEKIDESLTDYNQGMSRLLEQKNQNLQQKTTIFSQKKKQLRENTVDEGKKLREVITQLAGKISTLTYSLFLLGLVLVVSLLYVFFWRP